VTDELARCHPNLRPMTEIELPCCQTITRVDTLTDEIRCESCGIVLELADDEPIVESAAA
jgi:hypothetical protein